MDGDALAENRTLVSAVERIGEIYILRSMGNRTAKPQPSATEPTRAASKSGHARRVAECMSSSGRLEGKLNICVAGWLAIYPWVSWSGRRAI